MDGLAFYDYYTEELEHHGILGQKWGHQNGPPYPLDADDHSASERKAGWRKSLSEAAGNASAAIKKKTEEFKVYRAEKAAQNEEKKRIKAEEAEKKRIEDEAAAAEKHAADKASAIRSGDPSLVAQFASEMTIQEYREAVDRLNLANQVNKYLPQDEAKLTLTQKVSNFADNVQEKVDTYNKIAKLTNTFFKTDLPVLNESALDRAQKKADKLKKEKEEEEKKAIQKWKDMQAVSTAQNTIAVNNENARKRAEEAANREKKRQKEEVDKAWYAAQYEDRQRTAAAKTAEKERVAAEQERRQQEIDRADAAKSNYENVVRNFVANPNLTKADIDNAKAAYDDAAWRSKQSPSALDTYDASIRQLNAETANRNYTNISKDNAARSLSFDRALEDAANQGALFQNLDDRFY